MIIECSDLGRSFGTTTAVDSVSFTMAEGEFLALLGPNGAGKTTTLHMLTTVLAPSRGEARVLGADVRTAPEVVRAGIGMVFQEPALDDRLTAAENLEIHAALYGLPRRRTAALVRASLDWIGLQDAARRLVREFSGGMRRRLELARALMHEPRLLVLDEPTQGLDPQGRRDLWERIGDLRAKGLSVLMSTHNLGEAERCDRVAIIDRSRLIAIGPPRDLAERELGRTDAGLEDVFVALTGRALRDETASPRDRLLAFARRGGEHTR